MKILSKGRLAAVAASSVLALVLALSASGQTRDHGDGGRGGMLFSTSLAGSVLSDLPIHTNLRGGVPWQLKKGRASLTRNGHFRLELRRLVVAGTDNPGPVSTITASLYCAPDSDPTPAFTVGPVPLSSEGDAELHQRVTVPARCLAPVVLVHPNGNATRYIAATGWQL